MSPRIVIAGNVTTPTATIVAPRPAASGHRLAPGAGRAAGAVAWASVSIADTFESRTNTLIVARNTRATAAETRPIVPSVPFWVTP